MTANLYKSSRDPATGITKSCVHLCYSPDDDGWYAQEYNFLRRDNATRTSSKVYADRASLVNAISAGSHRWKKWD